MKKSIDPRIQFLLLILQSILVLCAGMDQLILLNVSALLYLIYSGFFQLAIKMSVVIAATTALYFYIVATDQQWIKILGFFMLSGLAVRSGHYDGANITRGTDRTFNGYDAVLKITEKFYSHLSCDVTLFPYHQDGKRHDPNVRSLARLILFSI